MAGRIAYKYGSIEGKENSEGTEGIVGRMRIGIDAREAFSGERTGKGMWCAKVIAELMERRVPITLFLEEGSGEVLPTPAESMNIIHLPGGPPWHVRVARFIRQSNAVDLYLSPTSYIVPQLLKGTFPSGIVVHDLIAFEDEPHDLKAKFIERIMLPRALRRAKHIFTVSDATKRELLRLFPRTAREKITVVYGGPTCAPLRGASVDKRAASSSYILCIGTLCPRKNQLRLIQAFNLLPENLRTKTKLLLVGKRGWEDEEIVALARASPNVEWKGYVSDTEREHLLRGATLFAYPSLSEGFGIPVLDALMLGIPTLTGNQSSLPEVVGDGALLIDPRDTEEMAEALEQLLTNASLRESIVSKGKKQAEKFSWKRTVDLLLEALEE